MGKKGGNKSQTNNNNNNNQNGTAPKKEKKEKKDDFDALMKQLAEGTARKAPTTEVSSEDAKKNRKKKAAQLREAKEEVNSTDLMHRMEQQRQQMQIQQLLQMLQQNRTSDIFEEVAVTKKVPLEELEDSDVQVALCGMQGWRKNMEDAHIADLKSIQGHKYFAVFDGHVGRQAADHLASTLSQRVAALPEFKSGDYEKAFQTAYLAADVDLRNHDEGSGCTACSAVLTSKKSVVCANVGDSRAVLSRKGQAVALSEDHKPELPAEEERIKKAGGHVAHNRVNGQLAMSRAMGDFTYKQDKALPATEQQVSPLPDVTEVSLCQDDEFLIVACDGVWDCLTNQEAVELVSKLLKEGKTPKEIVQIVADRCCCPAAPTGGPSQAAGTDNVTVVLVVFRESYRSTFPKA